MSKKTKSWLIIASFLILFGCIIFGGVMAVLKWDFTKLSTTKYVTNDYEIIENYKNISITTDTADIKLIFTKDTKGSVVCYEQKNSNHAVAVKDDTLVIEAIDTRKWYEHIGISFVTPKITVYIPYAECGTLSIKSSTGNVEIPKEFKFESIDISEKTGDLMNYASAQNIKLRTNTGNIAVENISADTLDLSVTTGSIYAASLNCKGDIKIKVSTGKTNLIDAKCKNLVSGGNTGDIYLNNVIATEKFSIERSTGDVMFDNSDASEIFVKTDTGDVKGSLLYDKVFITKTDTGTVDVPKTFDGGRCEITTDTGDIRIKIHQ